MRFKRLARGESKVEERKEKRKVCNGKIETKKQWESED